MLSEITELSIDSVPFVDASGAQLADASYRGSNR